MRGLLLDSDYLKRRDPPAMRLFVKKDGETITVLDPNFRHYFYVLSEDPDSLSSAVERVEADRRGETVKPESVEVVEKQLLGDSKDVVKVVVSNPLDITPLRKEIRDLPKVDKIYEYDIPPARRYLIDHELTPMSGIEVEGELRENGDEKELIVTQPPEPAEDLDVDLNIMSFDIEAYGPSENPRPEKDPIIMLSIVDNQGFEKVLTWKDFNSDDNYVEVVEDEEELLKRFVQIIREEDFDVITGYNSDLFDFPYIEERASQLNVELEIGRGDSLPKTHRRRFETVTRIPGRPHIDIYAMVDFLSKIGAMRLIDYTLENVYEHMMDKSKPDLEYSDIPVAWEEGGNKGRELLEYSLSDSEAALELAMEVFPLTRELGRTVKQSLFDVSRMTPGQLVEWLLVFRAHKVDELVPARPVGKEYQKRRGKSYIGGYVKEPDKGLHEDLVVFDFRSLPAYEPVYLRGPEDELVVEEIGELDKVVERSEEWKVLSFNTESMEVEWQSLRGIIVHENDFDSLCRLRTETGKEITVTPNHSVYTLDTSGRPVVRDAGEVETGDNLIAPKKLPIEERGGINLLKLLRGSELPVENVRLFIPRSAFPSNERLQTWEDILELLVAGKKLEDLYRKVPRHREVVRDNLRAMDAQGLVRYDGGDRSVEVTEEGRKYRQLLEALDISKFKGRYLMYASVEDIEPEWLGEDLLRRAFLKPKNAYWSRKMPVIWEPDKDTCWAMGMFVAEGWTDLEYHRAHFSNMDPEILKKLLTVFERFDPEYVNAESDFEVRVAGLFPLLLAELFGRTSKDRRIGGAIYSLPDANRRAFVSGMVEGDGSVSEKSFKYTSSSKALLHDLQNLLLTLERPESALRQSGKGLHDLRILSDPERLGPYDGKREQHPVRLVPREFAEDSLTSEFKVRHRGARIAEKKVFEHIGERDTKLNFFKGDAGLERVVDVEEVEYDGKLYDLSVEGNQNFFAGSMPLLVHNSLYPTILVTHNIDPATLDCDCCDSEETVSPPNLSYEFCQDKRGFIPDTLEGLIEDRAELKGEMKDLDEDSREYQSIYNRQWALKIIANSFYGMLGYPRARWYSKECAESVTSFGRDYIKNSIEMAEAEDFDVVYSDTDSLLCKVGDKSRQDIEGFLEEVNEDMPGIMELELEDFYKRGVFITKKRYAMVSEDGKMEVKGLEFVRRDWAALAKKTQEEVLRAVLEEGSPEKAAEIVQKVTKDVKQGRVELENLVIHTQLKKPIEEYKSEGPHVAAARRLRAEGKEVEPGMTIAYIVEKGSGNISDRAIPVSEFEDRDYDPDYYIGHQILPAVMRVMEVLGYTEEELRYEETKQTKLGPFGNN